MKVYKIFNQNFVIVLVCLFFLQLLIYFPDLKIKEINLLVAYIYVLVISYKIFNGISILFLFLLAFGIFNLSNLYLSLLIQKKWWDLEIFNYGKLSIIEVDKTLQILNVSILGIIFGIIIYLLFNKNQMIIDNIQENKLWEKLSKYLIYVSFFPLLLKNILEYNIVKKIGYVALYNGNFYQYSLPFWTKGWNMLFTFSYYLFLVSKPTLKNFKKCTILFFIISIVQTLKGGRTALVVNVFLVLTCYIILYKKQIKILFISIYMFPLVIGLQFISNLRSANYLNNTFFYNIIKFFQEQGGSVGVIGLNFIYRIDYIINYRWMIFSPIVDHLKSIGESMSLRSQSLEALMRTTNLSAHLSYAINKKYYLLGYGVGGNYLAELYNFGGYFCIFFVNIVLAYFLLKIQKNILKSRLRFYLMIPILKNIYISPRASLFPLLPEILNFYIIYVIFCIIVNILKKIQKNIK